ncbi:GFA family protein [Novosphingobium sp. M1R2S20]|uniref:GFA family protein n=1 Tax=Novosphingobium rhizovicinum TaxID=3228928 RepID=A0ABV3RCP2_9SPHN
MQREGGCQCGQVRYAVTGEPVHAALCHCADCRASAGAPVMAWAAFASEHFSVLSGDTRAYNSSDAVYRHFCPNCGTGLWDTNEEVLPGLVDLQIATLDDPETIAPSAHIQVAERLSWMSIADNLPQFERFPGA